MTRNQFLLCLLLIGSVRTPAQNFRLFDPGRTDYFKETYRSGPNPALCHWFDSYTVSPIKAARIDSSSSSGNDTLLFPFRSWKDTFTVDYVSCGYKNGPGWMGLEIREMSTGQTVLHTLTGDSVTIWQTAGFAPWWTFVSFANGKSIGAQLDSFFVATVAGITDTIKQIRLTAFDSSGAIDLSAPLHNQTLWLSKSHGMFKTLSFSDLPEFVELWRIPDVAPVSPGEIYDFNIGDEFEYISSCQGIFGGSTGPPSYRFVRILNKWHAPSLSMDTLFYSRMVIHQSFTFNPFPSAHLDTVTVTSYDTVSYPNPMGALYTTVPEQNGLLKLLPEEFGTYRLSKDSALFENRSIYTETNGYYSVFDSCIQLNHFEPIFYTRSVAPGIGEVRYETDQRSIAGSLCHYELCWYKKDSVTYGNYHDIFIGTGEINPEISLLIYPNPFTQRVVVDVDPQQLKSIRCYSPEGKLFFENESVERNTVIDTEKWPAGIYFFCVTGNRGDAAMKLVKQ